YGLAEADARTQVGEGADAGLGADDGELAVCAHDVRPGPDLGVLVCGVRPDDGAGGDVRGAEQLCAGQDRHILTDRDIDVDPRGVRVDDGDSGAHELLALAAVELLAQVGQLDAVVRSFDLPQIAGDGGRHRPAGLTGEADDIG